MSRVNFHTNLELPVTVRGVISPQDSEGSNLVIYLDVGSKTVDVTSLLTEEQLDDLKNTVYELSDVD